LPEAVPGSAAELIPGFVAESDLERALAADRDVLRGLAWGRPRTAHPEGQVGRHVADLLDRVAAEPAGALRSRLRAAALVHDSQKFRVIDWLPHWGPNHHGPRARRVAELYTDDEGLLATVELHDRPYGIWKSTRRLPRARPRRLERLIARIADPELFLRFVELDGSTEGKRAEPVRWFREQLSEQREPAGGRPGEG
jgi:hypothetical protein